MTNWSRTPGNKQRLALKSMFKRQIIPDIVVKKWESLINLFVKTRHKIGKSAGGSSKKKIHSYNMYILEEVLGPNSRRRPQIMQWTFKKQQLPGSIHIIGKKQFKVVKQYGKW